MGIFFKTLVRRFKIIEIKAFVRSVIILDDEFLDRFKLISELLVGVKTFLIFLVCWGCFTHARIGRIS